MRVREFQARVVETAGMYLEHKGYEVLDTNAENNDLEEFDIVSVDGGELVFVDVAARMVPGELPGEVVTEDKKIRKSKAARRWLTAHPEINEKNGPTIARFDFIGITPADHEGKAYLRHHVNYINADFVA